MPVFEATIESKLAELQRKPFQKESVLHKLVEDNIDVLFPGLEMLKNEMGVDKYRVDTVAFDKNLNTFVVLEYKNKKDSSAITQAKAYMNKMKDHKAEFVLRHGMGYELGWYKWNNVYSIIIAPSFTDHTIDAAKNDDTIQLYTIEAYGNNIVVMNSVGGDLTRPKGASVTDHTAVSDISQGGIGMKELTVRSGTKPTHVALPNSMESTKVHTWKELHATVIEWLIDNGKINNRITTRRGRVLFTFDKAESKNFINAVPVKSGWFDGNKSAKNHVDSLVCITEYVGMNPNSFKISVSNT